MNMSLWIWLYTIHYGHTVWKTIVNTIICIWEILIILSANVSVIKIVSRSFLFWFEVSVALKYNVLLFIMLYKFEMYCYDPAIYGNIMRSFKIIFFVIIASMIDGFHT